MQNVISLGGQKGSPLNIGEGWEREDDYGPRSHNYKAQDFCSLKQVVLCVSLDFFRDVYFISRTATATRNGEHLEFYHI